jgi:hypothetical protein
MLLKRCLLELSCPKVLFLHPDKWGFGFRFNSCHPVCDDSFSWEKAKSLYPIAIALAARTKEQQQRLGDSLMENGFEHVDAEEPPAGSEGPWSIIAANSEFERFFRVEEE